MKRRSNWMQRMAEELEANEDPLPRHPLVEICGERRVLIENHQGVSRYGKDQIWVKVCYGEIAVRGSALELSKMTREQMVICGKIENVSLIRRRE
jgi:sporulation protein YqfC